MKNNTFYHIYNRANGNESLFVEDKNYHYFMEKWEKYIAPIASIYSYCLMPNHFHFLILIKKEEDITFGKYQTFQMLASKSFSNLFSSYSQAFNKVYKRKGSLFIPNFKRKEIISENNLLNVIGYIHRNPVHHGFVSRMEDWDYSSYNNILSDTNDTINSKEILELFGGQERFIDYHNKYFEGWTNQNLTLD